MSGILLCEFCPAAREVCRLRETAEPLFYDMHFRRMQNKETLKGQGPKQKALEKARGKGSLQKILLMRKFRVAEYREKG